ncbi:hypothetical protein KM043_015714 [Ampulex compressa]|nr:hypothetical protein KM043_015714 [Ampulex compressa]
MAGLTLISTYLSDSEDEETEHSNSSNKINPSLPLPESISSWKGVVHFEEVIDDPSKHEGRSRSFKHERGIWATLAYINYTPSKVMHCWMNSALAELPVKA